MGRAGEVERGDRGFPQHTGPLDSITPPFKKKSPSVELLLPESYPLSQDPTTAASPVSQDLSSLLRRAQQAHCSTERRPGQLGLS